MRAMAILIATAALALAAVVGPLVFAYREPPPAAVVPEPVGMGEPDLVYKQGTMAIRLKHSPCEFSGIELILQEEGVPPVLSYVMVQDGRPEVRGCWVKAAYDDEVLVMDMGGGDSFMPLSWFKPDPGV